jgi:RNA polymerase sigma-70 factor (ECF subfamily)
MAESSSPTVQIQAWIDRLRAGDEAARNELLRCACNRLQHLARKMIKSYPNVHRWEQTDDVLQNALVRLHRTLHQLPLETTRDFFRLAAVHIRRELLDLARHHYGPHGQGAHHASDPGTPRDSDESLNPTDPSGTSLEPGHLAVWSEFHAQIEALPDEEREVFDLLWYQELTQGEAAETLGVSIRTVKRRWMAARLRLEESLEGDVPE